MDSVLFFCFVTSLDPQAEGPERDGQLDEEVDSLRVGATHLTEAGAPLRQVNVYPIISLNNC